jgi:hypothetical protein
MGVPSNVAQPTATETWFAVFVRIENRTNRAAETAKDFYIEDTEGGKYTPIPLDTKSNPFAYLPQTLAPDEVMPQPDSAQDFDAAAGSMLLFKLPLTGYQNRPLELHVESPDGSSPKAAKVALDV